MEKSSVGRSVKSKIADPAGWLHDRQSMIPHWLVEAARQEYKLPQDFCPGCDAERIVDQRKGYRRMFIFTVCISPFLLSALTYGFIPDSSVLKKLGWIISQWFTLNIFYMVVYVRAAIKDVGITYFCSLICQIADYLGLQPEEVLTLTKEQVTQIRSQRTEGSTMS